MKLNEFFTGASSLMGKRGDIHVSVASGIPRIVTNKKGSMKIEVQPSTAQRPIGGYIHEDSIVGKILVKAAEDGHHVLLRTEKQRKKNIAEEKLSIPMSELSKDMNSGRENVINAIVGVYNFTDKSWVLSGNEFDPANDPDNLKYAPTKALELGVDPDSFFVEPQVKIPNPKGFDYQQALITIYYYVIQLEKKYEYELKEDMRRNISIKLLALADEIQKVIKQADVVDYRDYSHTRARYLVFNYEEYISNLNKENLKNLGPWLKDALTHSKEILNWANVQ